MKLFCDAQHGFVPGRSYITRLLVTTELWTRILDENTPVDTAYLDFKNIACNMSSVWLKAPEIISHDLRPTTFLMGDFIGWA